MNSNTFNLSSLTSIGMRPEDDIQLRRQIKATNSSILLGVVVFLFFMPVNFLQGNPHITLKMVYFVAVLGVAYGLSAIRFFTTAWVIAMLSMALFCFLSASYWLPGKRSEIFLFLIMTVTILFFTNKWLMAVSSIVCAFFYILPQLLYKAYSENFGYFVFAVQFTSSFFIVFYFKRLFEELLSNLYKQREKELKDKQLITQQAKELEYLYEMKSNFLANVSHDLRTPLTLIVGNTERMSVENPSSVSIQKRTHEILKNAGQLQDDIEDILDASKLEFGEMEWHLEPVDIIDYIRKRTSPFNSLAEQKNIKFEVNIPTLSKSPQVMIDRKQFTKVINNLLSNAFKFSSEGTVKINLSATIDQLQITCSDSGIGIPEDELPYVFDRFYRGKNVNRSAYPGSGIGLSLAKEIVDQHDGIIDVKSETGNGSTFTISLPIHSFVSHDSPVPNHDEHHPNNNKAALDPLNLMGDKKMKWQHTILLVDDNQSLLDYLAEILEDYHTLTASDGMEALRVLDQNAVDLLISDIMMPEMSGYELVGRIKQSESHSTIPIILLTAKSLEEDKLRGLRIGIDDYLTKPFLAEELMARVNNLISNRTNRLDMIEAEIPGDQCLSVEDGELVEKFSAIVRERLADSSLNVKQIGSEIGLSERQLYRKLGQVVGYSPNNLIKEIRLRQAYEILRLRTARSVKEVSFQVGFDSPSYFSKEFKKRFGKKPMDMI